MQFILYECSVKKVGMNDERRFITLSETVTFETDSSRTMKMEINKNAIDILDLTQVGGWRCAALSVHGKLM